MYHGRLLADKDPANNRQKIVEMYKKSLQLFADHDGNYVSEEGYRSFNSFLIKLAMYDDAAENLKKQIDMYEDLKQPHNVYKCYLSIVIVMLAKDDWVAADESHQSYLMYVVVLVIFGNILGNVPNMKSLKKVKLPLHFWRLTKTMMPNC